ncbi:uncharacterized protein DUF3667 [Chryseobacterium sp. 52]|uniref:DUF3667 domain-containing protein n=1 Tax=Chryseobacterium sp. 52 TaxID=2035213 RepID=UPI000C17E4AB|nr:DUF3667 domain-containing protein [Chryseobacterium sp. 52]PIF47727.1 uncharacterized protein DUF3667 [Chryseobacterium sp. 52]
MSHGKIREEKNCLNCGHTVEDRFCSHCAQENTETRQPSHYLITHFIEDFTHYDGAFWKTIQYLLFRPGKLTTEYLSGKRQLYVAPVKLYIFISFLAFFLPPLINGAKDESMSNTKKAYISTAEQKEISKIKGINFSLGANFGSKSKITVELLCKNMVEYDSVVNASKDKTVLHLLRPIAEKQLHLREKGFTRDEITDKLSESIYHALPKALFFYLPIFAFFLWLFHNKKNWWYFEHGIFTLHYFSFLLILLLIVFSINELLSKLGIPVEYYKAFSLITILSAILLPVVYFFIAQYKVYKTKNESFIFLKGLTLFMINIIGIFLMFIILVYISFLMVH